MRCDAMLCCGVGDDDDDGSGSEDSGGGSGGESLAEHLPRYGIYSVLVTGQYSTVYRYGEVHTYPT